MCWQRHERFLWSEESEGWGPRPAGRRERATTPARRDDLRVSDADRQVVIDDLRQHTGDGRLTLDEFEERVDQALQARTGLELQTVTRDLPSLRPAEQARRQGFRIRIRPGAVLVLAVVAVLLLSGHWWVLFPVGFFLFGGGGHHARHRPHPRRDDRDDSPIYA